MSFGAGFGASTPATQSTFSFGTANSTMSTPVKPSIYSIILYFYILQNVVNNISNFFHIL